MKRFCNKCNESKQVSEFYSRGGKRKSELTSWCKSCLNVLTLERQRDRKKEAINYKGGKCQLCGYAKCQDALDFHHIDPSEKDFNLSASRLTSFSKMKGELDKCVLLCANCHRELHSKI